MVIGNPPRAGIEIEALVECAGLAGTTEFSEAVAAAKSPVAAPRPIVELKDPHLVTGVGRETERGHRVIHRGTAGNRSDQGQQVAPTNECRFVLHRYVLLNPYPAPEPRYNDIPRRPSSAYRRPQDIYRELVT